MATHLSVLAWKIPRIEEPGVLQSMVSQRVRHDLVTEQQQKDHMRRNLQAKKNALVEVCQRFFCICRMVLPDHLIQRPRVFAFLSNSICVPSRASVMQ